MKKLIIFIFCSLSSYLNAQQSFVPDNSFGNNGVAFTNLNYSHLQLSCHLITSDGKILMAIYASNDNNGGNNYDYFLVKYNSNGTLDTNYGLNGYVSISQSTTPETKLYETYNGKILFCNILGISRFNSDGSLDLSFGGSGTILQNKGAAIAIQNDGKIIASYPHNYYLFCGGGCNILKIERYFADGSLNNTFNIANTEFNNILYYGKAEKILIQSDGRILLVFSRSSSTNIIKYEVHRFSSNGEIETNFIDVESGGYYNGIILQNDGKLIFGKFYNSGYGSLTRYNVDFIKDLNYGINGVSNASSGRYGDFKIQPDNSVFCSTNYSNISAVYLKKIDSNGFLDTNFDVDGIQNLEIFYTQGMSAVNNSIFVLGHSDVYSPNIPYLYITKFNLTGNLGVNQINTKKVLNFTPNPAIDRITFAQDINSVTIYSIDGKLINTQLEDNSVDVSNLSKGVYLLQIIDENNLITSQKLIKD